MKTRILLLYFLTVTLQVGLSAQSPTDSEEVFPCGTPSHISPWLLNYIENRQEFAPDNDSLYYVPLTLHIVTEDDGDFGIHENILVTHLCQLQADFSEANMHFYIEGEIDYIANSDFFRHDDVIAGAGYMFTHNVENTVNIYFVGAAAGNAGYNLNYAGIAMRNGSVNFSSHTLTHELGHQFSVQHPFLGWEGGVSYDNSISHSFNVPAPEQVLYDYTYFKDSLITDTTIIDTSWVEYVDGRNCAIAADKFCDTKPDYLYFRWNCDENGMSEEMQTDPSGERFRSDGSLFMSYSDGRCQNRFSPEQIAAMRANLTSERSYLLYDQTPPNDLTDRPANQFPAPEDTLATTEVTFSWEGVEYADFYMVKVTRKPNGSGGFGTYMTYDTFLNVDNFFEDRTYYWTVVPYSNYHFCTQSLASDETSFTTGKTVDTRRIHALRQWKIHPNPVPSNGRLQVDIDVSQSMQAQFEIIDILGRTQFVTDKLLNVGNSHFSISVNLPSGTYILRMNHEGRHAQHRFVVH